MLSGLLLRSIVPLMTVIGLWSCGWRDPIADHQSRIVELRDDGMFTVEGAIVRSGSKTEHRVTARLTQLPPLKLNQVRAVREWMSKTIDQEYVSCAVLEDQTLDILALRAGGKDIVRLHEEILKLLNVESEQAASRH